MTRRTFDSTGSTGISEVEAGGEPSDETEPVAVSARQSPGVGVDADPTPVMAFTLIDGGAGREEEFHLAGDDADDDAYESLSDSSHRVDAPGVVRTAPPVGGSLLRKILGTGGASPVEADSGESAAGNVAGGDGGTAAQGWGSDDSASLLRPHPAEDRLDSEYTRVPSTVVRRHPSSRRFGRRSR